MKEREKKREDAHVKGIRMTSNYRHLHDVRIHETERQRERERERERQALRETGKGERETERETDRD